MVCTVLQMQIYNILKACGESDWVDILDHLMHTSKVDMQALYASQPDIFNIYLNLYSMKFHKRP